MKMTDLGTPIITRKQAKFGLPKQVWQTQEKTDRKDWTHGSPKKGPPYRQSKSTFHGQSEGHDEHILKP